VSRHELARLAREVAAQEAAARAAAQAGKVHPFRSTTKALSGGPCAYCGQGLMAGRHK
jgi:hypothetical protein